MMDILPQSLKEIAKTVQRVGENLVVTTKNGTVITYNEKEGGQVTLIGDCSRFSDFYYDRRRTPIQYTHYTQKRESA